MFNLYLVDKPNGLENYNDGYFYSNCEDYRFEEAHARIVKNIDNSMLDIKNKLVMSKYNPQMGMSLEYLSTGSKTALNIMCNTDKVFNLVECGNNALAEIFRLSEGNGFLDRFRLPEEFSNTIMVHYKDEHIQCSSKNELWEILERVTF